MKQKYLLTTVFLIGYILFSFSQNSKQIFCKVLDLDTKYPVSFATIKFEGVQNGIIADEDGGFRLPIEYKTLNKSIIISSIGFETSTVFVGTLNNSIVNVIYLKPRIEPLSAVLVTGKTSSNGNTNTRDLSAKTIIKNAIGKIPANYPYFPHSYIAYYRDYQLVNNKYYNLNEAILENFDAGFNTSKYLFKDNATALYSYSPNKNFYQDTLLLNSIYGESKILDKDNNAKLVTDIQNELEILNIHNPIRNYNKNSFSFIYVFRNDFVNNHLFELKSIKYVEDIPLYEIEFVTRENPNSKYMGKGRIFIAKSNYAIHKIEYGVFKNKNYNSIRSKDDAFGNLLRKSGSTLFEVNVEYKEIDGKMFLNYMTFNNRFIIKEPNPFKVENFDFDPNDKCFYITFNKPVDESSIKRRSNFKLRYKDKKLIVSKISLHDTVNTVKIEVVHWSGKTSNKVKDVKSEDFSYKLKKIKDTFGTVINKESRLIGYQFREFFTQEVFENKTPKSDFIFVNKTMPLSATNTNSPSFDVNKYWINSPLKKTKDVNR